MEQIIFKEESYQIMGCCMAVHNFLGDGFLEEVYKEALEIEFRNANIPFERFKEYEINYKGEVLKHRYVADIVVFDKIILIVKGVKELNETHTAQAINFLKVSGKRLALVVNFCEPRLSYKRLIL